MLLKTLKARPTSKDVAVKILDDGLSGPIYWADEYETKPGRVIDYHLAVKISDVGMCNHRWFHLIVTVIEPHTALKPVNLFTQIPRDLGYMADSIIDLTHRRYIKNRATGQKEEGLDKDFIDFLMDWPVTEPHNLYSEVRRLTGRKLMIQGKS